jgi:hypothetical protein
LFQNRPGDGDPEGVLQPLVLGEVMESSEEQDKNAVCKEEDEDLGF